MYPKTNNERKRRGVEWECSYCEGAKEMEFRIFDKSGKCRSKIQLDEKSLSRLKESIRKCMGT